MNSKQKHPATVVFLGFIFLFFLANLLLPDREFSERENRYLQRRPRFTLSRLVSGDYTADFEDFCADQFPLRDQWITLNARYNRLCGKKESNGIYLCNGGRLLEPFVGSTPFATQSRVEVINNFASQTDVPVTLGLIPGAAEFYSELLPKGAPAESQQNYIDSVYNAVEVGCVDISSALRPRMDEEIFYRTDHHWTTLGAYYGYAALGEALGYEPDELTSFARQTVSTEFYGTAYSSSGYTWVEPDRMECFVAEPAGLAVLNYNSGTAETGALYHPDKLSEKDKYTYFLGGNTPLITLKNEDSPSSSLLILRDSYSDCLAPFLLKHFSEIHLMDLRYYKESVLEYIEEKGIDRVLILYSVDNFSSDNSLLMLDA